MTTISARTAVYAVSILSMSLPAFALNTRTWVSGKGVDQAGCGPIATPCRTLQYAHDNTVSSGEIDVLDSAGYGPLAISKSISVIGDGSVAGVLSSGTGNAITITADVADSITLSGLSIEGAGVGSYGIKFTSGGKLTVTRCIVQQFAGTGIYLSPASGTVNVTILDSIVTNSASGIGYAVGSTNTTTAQIFLSRVTASNNSNYGLIVNGVGSGTASIQVSDTNFVGNASVGLYFNQPVGTGSVSASIDRSYSAFNGAGMQVLKASVRLNQSTITGNATQALFISGGTLTTLNNNNISGSIVGTLTQGALQ